MTLTSQFDPATAHDKSAHGPNLDPTQFRAGQRQLWNGCAAGWKKWSKLIDAGASTLSGRMVELASIEPGNRVLDVACGYGEPALTAAQVAGPHGSVLATDISSGMIAFGRQRSAAAALANIDFVESAASSLDLPKHSFDAALSRFGLIFEPEAEATAARIRSFLKPGARFVLCSWATPDRVPFLGIPLKTTLQALQLPAPPKGMPGPFARPSVESLRGFLESAGFTDITTEEADVPFAWPSADEFTTFIEETVPPITALMAQHPAEKQTAIWAAITATVHRMAEMNGKVRLVNRAVLACGRA